MIELLGIKFHAYGLLIGIGVYLAWEISKKFGKVEDKVLEKLLPWLLIFGIIGARTYHVIDQWKYYSVNLKEIFYIWNGGLGIWGAILSGIIFLFFYTKIKKLDFWRILDSIVIGVPLAQAIGRLGNFVNGELFGKNGEPLFAWEGGLNLILQGILIYLVRQRLLRRGKTPRNDGMITGVYLLGYGLIRIFLENFRPDSIIWRIGGMPTAIIFGVISAISGLTLIFINLNNVE